jgi:hypothetical protein
MQLGRLHIGCGLTLDASMTEASLHRALTGEVRPLVHNEAHRSYLLPKTTLHGRTFTPSIYFKDGKLTGAHLTWADPEIKGGSPWEDFSFERERGIPKADAAWLEAAVGGVRSPIGRYTFDWGTIWSGFDERSGFSSVVIRYSQA